MAEQVVMKHDQDSEEYEAECTAEYEQAVAKGFQGTKEEYLQYRDYT